jgi:hypothetical protein
MTGLIEAKPRRTIAERPAGRQQVRHCPGEGVSRNTRPLKIPAGARHTTHDHVSQFLVLRRCKAESVSTFERALVRRPGVLRRSG